jgi:hypothetical protein
MIVAMNGCSAVATKYTGMIVTNSVTNDRANDTR